ncbi:hypothetical protein [Raoultella planticola]|uniref:hypothetical protein n=1 Tax=Raoultella planticola TaxID=575 RepID=UPI0007EB728F|nr:hypothetical protein [Raoultella planticola]EKW3527456.1 hypothetical protein [Raoultella planticola]ELC3573989.1 hypothetical protein [Raoultella planticola]ELF4970789.1 hypothetical protein [Raoultella planticola]ELH7938138.1 hypothetical protein [Raoultella planticola]ELN0130013.1 hypothetical protein [Raoultella planticola]
MQTFKQMKAQIDFCQTDDFFLEYLQRLMAAEVIQINDGDIDVNSKTLSDDFCERLANVYGVNLDEELNLATPDKEK